MIFRKNVLRALFICVILDSEPSFCDYESSDCSFASPALMFHPLNLKQDRTGCAMNDIFNKKDIIYTIYQEKSFSKAAQKLFIAQPSLSVIVKRIEDEIGIPLFDRTSKPIRMTEAGMEYIRATEAIRHIENAFVNYVDAVNDLQTGTLTIGSNQLISSLVLPKYISKFIAKYPHIHLDLIDDNSIMLKNLISTGQVDLVIDNQTLDPEIFEQHIFRTEYLLLAVPAFFDCNRDLEDFQLRSADILRDRHISDEVPAVDLKAFSGIPFVFMTHDNDTRERTDHIFKDFTPHMLFEIDRLVTLYNFIELGTAASVVSDTLVKNTQQHSGNVVFYKLDARLARRDIYVSYKKNKYYSKAMRSFIELICQQETGTEQL